MAATGENNTSNPLEASNCDNVIQDGKRSVRDIKFMFDQAASSEKSQGVVFNSMRNQSRETSTDCTLDRRIRKMKDIFEAPNETQNTKKDTVQTTEANNIQNTEEDAIQSTEKSNIESTENSDKSAIHSDVEMNEDKKHASEDLNGEAATENEAECEKKKTLPVRDSVDMRASAVITSSFSFLPTFDDCDDDIDLDKEVRDDAQTNAEVKEVKDSEVTEVKDSEVTEVKDSEVTEVKDSEVQKTETQKLKVLEEEPQGEEVQEAQNEELKPKGAPSEELKQAEEVQDQEVKPSEAQNVEVCTKEICKEDTLKTEANSEVATVELHEDTLVEYEQSNDETMNQNNTEPSKVTADTENTENTQKEVPDSTEGNVECKSNPVRNSEASRVSEFITSSFSFLPQVDDDTNIDDTELDDTEQIVEPDVEQITENKVNAEELEEGSDSLSSATKSSQNDSASDVQNDDYDEPDKDATEARTSSHSVISRSSSQSSTDSAILRDAEKRGNLRKLTRKSSRKGLISEAGSNLEQTLSAALQDDQLRRKSDQDIGASGSESPRLRPKVERSSSSGSYDGCRTLERLRSRSRSNSPGISDGSDDDEDDDEGKLGSLYAY